MNGKYSDIQVNMVSLAVYWETETDTETSTPLSLSSVTKLGKLES